MGPYNDLPSSIRVIGEDRHRRLYSYLTDFCRRIIILQPQYLPDVCGCRPFAGGGDCDDGVDFLREATVCTIIVDWSFC